LDFTTLATAFELQYEVFLILNYSWAWYVFRPATIIIDNAECHLASLASAQTAKFCPSEGGSVCYSVNVPSNTASSGTGDIFFQIQGTSSHQWIGLGQGAQMTGSNIFIIYADSSGKNVTLSPRLGKGNFQPQMDTDAKVTLLDGSGIANGVMTANVRCTFFTLHLRH